VTVPSDSTAVEAVEAASAELGDLARADVPLGPLTTYRVGGAAALFVDLTEDAHVARVAAAVGASDLPVLVVGNGSNLLVADGGFPGIAVRLGGGFADVDIDGTTVRAGGAALLPVVARRTARAGLTGFEWAVGVPGSIGGAVRMNAGGHGSDMEAVLRGADVFDVRTGERRFLPVSALDLGYRHSAVESHQIVVRAELALSEGDRAAAEAEIAEIVRWRRANQPGGQNAGSVFTNPPGDAAGRLIDEAGARGLRLGTARVSPKHANFFIADPGGRADDVFALMVEVRRRVAESCGVVLEPETRLVGFGPLPEVGP
jgi:UDP-N-acetylmuramate dehydrogenase